jgi:hypothetical protein
LPFLAIFREKEYIHHMSHTTHDNLGPYGIRYLLLSSFWP